MSASPVADMLPARSQGGFPKSSILMLTLFFAFVVGSGSWSPACAAITGSEYQVKAAFLYNFLKFVEWPADGRSSSGTVCLGVLGLDPFDDALEAFNGKYAKGRKVVVTHFRSMEEVKDCDLLFVCASEKRRLHQILKLARNSGMLTVADQEGFCEAGGMINLVFIKNRVGFEINLAAASREKLRVSSQLLKVARIVLE
jgi:hypothetical protein